MNPAAEPTPLHLRFRQREDTYRNRDHVHRSFYKFVAKELLYNPMRIGISPLGYSDSFGTDVLHHRWPSKHIRTQRYGTQPYGWRGMPVFREWKSYTYNCWQRKFLAHRERWEKEHTEAWRRKWDETLSEGSKALIAMGYERLWKKQANEARKRHRLHSGKTVKFFQQIALSGTLQK